MCVFTGMCAQNRCNTRARLFAARANDLYVSMYVCVRVDVCVTPIRNFQIRGLCNGSTKVRVFSCCDVAADYV